MYLWVTILSMLVVIPFAVGVRYFKRLPTAYQVIVYLCGLWTIAEVYSFALRMFSINNAHVSYVLTALEIHLFSSFFYYIITQRARLFRVVAVSGYILVIFDAVFFSTPLNTFSLTVEYVILTGFSLYLFYEIITGRASHGHLVANLTFLFYLLSSFPYFFAWEWLRISDMELLRMLADIHVVVHALCYLTLTYAIWKSSLYYLPRR